MRLIDWFILGLLLIILGIAVYMIKTKKHSCCKDCIKCNQCNKNK